MISHPLELIDGVKESLEKLAESYKLMVITKGDLLEQETKLARSGLASLFKEVEIVSEKQPHVYADILRRYKIPASNFYMVGNSLKSDIIPVLKIGGNAIHIPYHTTWIHEKVEDHQLNGYHYWKLGDIREVDDFLAS